MADQLRQEQEEERVAVWVVEQKRFVFFIFMFFAVFFAVFFFSLVDVTVD